MRKLVLMTFVLVVAVAGGAAAAGVPRHTASPTAAAASTVAVPKVHCRRLDVAEDIVRSKGLRVVERGGGTFGIVVKSNWVVGSQRPAAGTGVRRGSRVYLYASREC